MESNLLFGFFMVLTLDKEREGLVKLLTVVIPIATNVTDQWRNKKENGNTTDKNTPRKEPAKKLTLEQKLDLINHAKNGVKNVDLCKMYNICKSSVAEILGKKEIYLSEVEKRRKLSGRIDTVNKKNAPNLSQGVLLREGDFLFAEFCDNRNV
ncbi:hypothetical protein NQ318_008990 [Aromia moschata]|uniref:HTH psq-type domain-containing protein n=1 Tax=Aromia moschata TaxID=1265417 RepID=A0AAV8XE61_9CUCU|nr:hypothetical protein NQ318_008990 [Aromia moschata]